MASNYDDLNNALNTFNTTLQGLTEANQRNKYNEQVLDMSKDMQAWTKDFNERQFAESQKQWDSSFAFNVGAANLAQGNFENATQIRANDMLKAGLNPLNLVGGAEGSTANFMSGSSPAGSASSGIPSPLAPFSLADLFSKIMGMRHETSENDKNRRSAEKIASIQANSAQNVAQINSEASKYGSNVSAGSSRYATDKSFSASSNRDVTDRTIALWQKEVKDAELSEKKFEFDQNMYKDIKFKEMDYEHQRALELVRQYGDNARVMASLNEETYKSALSAYTNIVRNNMDFALGINRLKLAYDELAYAKTRDDKDRAQRNFQAIMEDTTRQMSNYTNLAGDICKGFLLRNVVGR